MKVSNPADVSNASSLKVVRNLISNHVYKGHSFALWRLPQEGQTNLIFTEQELSTVDNLQIEDLEAGFVMASFNRNGPTYYLKADRHYKMINGEIISLKGDDTNTPQENVHQSFSKLNTHLLDFRQPSAQTKHDFISIVERSTEAISDGRFEKVVPSRYKLTQLSGSVDLLDVFENLCHSHPDAMVSIVSTPMGGTWIGASPELLVSIDENQIFKTVSLAGTQLVQPGTNLRSVAWTQKEIEEQALVSRYIINCFKTIRLREFVEHGPKTIQAGNLMHLKTEFEVDMKATNFPQLGSVMLKLLHPTSAVCGMPHEPAMDFLNNNEKYSREFYSGFLGPVNIDNNSNIFVNLRCMQRTNDGIILYAGAGVTVDSTPDSEWEETELKMNTLLASLK